MTRIGVGASSLACLCVVFGMSASARYIDTLDVYVSGTSPDVTNFVHKTIDGGASGGCYRVQLNNPCDMSRGNIVLKTYMENSNHEPRSERYGETYEGTSNTLSNWGSAGYKYRLYCIREFTYDNTARVIGTWSPDQW